MISGALCSEEQLWWNRAGPIARCSLPHFVRRERRALWSILGLYDNPPSRQFSGRSSQSTCIEQKPRKTIRGTTSDNDGWHHMFRQGHVQRLLAVCCTFIFGAGSVRPFADMIETKVRSRARPKLSLEGIRTHAIRLLNDAQFPSSRYLFFRFRVPMPLKPSTQTASIPSTSTSHSFRNLHTSVAPPDPSGVKEPCATVRFLRAVWDPFSQPIAMSYPKNDQEECKPCMYYRHLTPWKRGNNIQKETGWPRYTNSQRAMAQVKWKEAGCFFTRSFTTHAN